MKNEKVVIGGIEYMPVSAIKNQKSKSVKGLTYCIVRTYSAEVLS